MCKARDSVSGMGRFKCGLRCNYKCNYRNYLQMQLHIGMFKNRSTM